jgi:cell division protein FtsI (penicillin-binding protein 3)
VQPRVVRAVIRDGKRAAVPRKVLRRVISPGTAAEMTRIMEGVVEDGTGTRAQLAGYTVAGKTGTANRIVNGAYSQTDYNVSFVGFVPSRDPVFAIVVVVDSPRKVLAYGGVVSAPIFQKIADAALRHYGVPPSVNPQPPLLVARRTDVLQQPASGPVDQPAIVTLAGTSDTLHSGFPDLAGMSARDALRELSRLGLTARLHGVGLVVDQRPAAGTRIDSGVTATLWLKRASPVQTAGLAKP